MMSNLSYISMNMKWIKVKINKSFIARPLGNYIEVARVENRKTRITFFLINSVQNGKERKEKLDGVLKIQKHNILIDAHFSKLSEKTI